MEFVQEFGEFMQQAPWFRFPFMKMLSTYFSTLSHEFRIVERKHGMERAGFSMGFIISLVPGIVMGGVFSALSALAIPCNMAFGQEFDGFVYTAEAASKQLQRLVVTLNSTSGEHMDWTAVHDDISAELVVPGIYMLRVPAFQAFTEVIKCLAHVPEGKGLHIVRVADQTEIQVRISTEDATQLAQIRAFRHCTVEFDYTIPCAPKMSHAACCVAVPMLLPFIRHCEAAGVAVSHVYDFYS